MPDAGRYLLGRGEQLTSSVTIARAVGEKFHPYSFSEAQAHLSREVGTLASALDALPAAACPQDEAVAILQLHPSYLARSYFPDELLGAFGVRSIGSRAAAISPRKGTSRQQGRILATVEIYASGKRSRFDRLAAELPSWNESHLGAGELRYVEAAYAPSVDDKLVPYKDGVDLFEAVLHAGATDEYVVEAFGRYVESLNGVAMLDDKQQAGGLCYVPVHIPSRGLEKVAAFTFLRGIRAMPQIRSFTPMRTSTTDFDVEILPKPAANPFLRVAVIDGGMPDIPDLTHWVTAHDGSNLSAPDQSGLDHGLAVTSAALFGPIVEGGELAQPYTRIEHFRVADDNDVGPNYYRMLDRVTEIISGEHYDYINLSVGPDVTLDDQLVHAWVARIDPLLSHGKTLAFIAVGNNGRNKAPKSARISAPADAVNGMGIGACDTCGSAWDKCDYSSVGPGRSPGIVKPDVVAFGGSRSEEFAVLQRGLPVTAAGVCGTSFASPYAMRTALGVATYFGHSLRPLAVKALLVHHAERKKSHSATDVGWGRVPDDFESIVLCEADTIHVVYQGSLMPGKYLRAPIPVPDRFGSGPVYITATICYAAEVEPQHPDSYTKAGLEVYFRPNDSIRASASQQHADTGSFFRAKDLMMTDAQLRQDAMKWETTLKKTRRFNDPTTLQNPVFDIHYVARRGGTADLHAKQIPYAMVVSVRQKGFDLLYDRVVSRYRTVLEVLRPSIQVPIRISP